MKITIDISTVKKAMEAMLYFPGDISDEMFESIRALRTALAQPQEPDSWGAGYEEGYAEGVAEHPAQPVQDTDCHAQGICQRSGYSLLAQRKPLSKAQIYKAFETALGKKLPNILASRAELVAITRAVEAAHGIK